MTLNPDFPVENFRKRMLDWFTKHKRRLPWRKYRTWYSIWISEVMLQQTQVEKVVPYYNRFMKRFPTLRHLVSADLQTVLKYWEGMGYYARARNLYKAAHIIQQSFKGVLPESENDISELPGFGPYITNAVLSIAFNKPLAVVDGNVARVITRIFEVSEDIRLTRARKKIQAYVNDLIDRQMPGIFNEAIMELGATRCLVQKPLCTSCPVNEHCRAFNNHTVSKYPHKSPPAPKKIVNAIALICFLKKKVLIAQRPYNGLLGGYWEFPNYNIPHGFSSDSLSDSEIMRGIYSRARHAISVKPIRHTYTHFQLNLSGRVYYLPRHPASIDFYQNYKWVSLEQVSDFPVHRAMTKMIERVRNLSEVVAK